MSGANLLVAIFSEQESQAVYFFEVQNVRPDVVNFIATTVSKDGEESPEGIDVGAVAEEAQEGCRKASSGCLRDKSQRGG